MDIAYSDVKLPDTQAPEVVAVDVTKADNSKAIKLFETNKCVSSKLVIEQKRDAVHLKIVSDYGESLLDVNNKITVIDDLHTLMNEATKTLFTLENRNSQDMYYYIKKRLNMGGLEVIVQSNLDMSNSTVFRKIINGETMSVPMDLKCAHINGFDVLVDPNWDIKQHDGYNVTSLVWACFFGKTDLARSLVDRGADVNQRAEKEITPLLAAILSNQVSIVQLLLENGAKVDQDVDTVSPLHTAAFFGRNNIARLLIEHGAPVNLETRVKGMTPLQFAIIKGQETMVTLLLSHGADVNTRTEDGQSPLLLAVRLQHTNIVHSLLEAGADINAQDNNGNTPLMVAIYQAVQEPAALSIAQKLRNQRNLNINLKNKEGTTALSIAHAKGFTKVEELLKSKGAVLSSKFINISTCLLIIYLVQIFI